jgi:hypothetical protein
MTSEPRPGQLDAVRSMQRVFSDPALVESLRGEGLDHPLGRTLAQIASPDLETAMLSGGAGIRDEFRGVDGFVEAWRGWLQPFESFVVEPEGEPFGTADTIVNYAHQTGVLSGGGEVTAKGAAVWFFRDGCLARIEFHLDREEALRAAGLAAEPG